MVRTFLTEQERREMFAELCEHYRKGELSHGEFAGKCIEIDVSNDDIEAAILKHGKENVRNWRNRTPEMK